MRAVNQPHVSPSTIAEGARAQQKRLSAKRFLTYTAASDGCFCLGTSVSPTPDVITGIDTTVRAQNLSRADRAPFGQAGRPAENSVLAFPHQNAKWFVLR